MINSASNTLVQHLPCADMEIKRQYRAMQRKYHPDIAGEQSRELSTKLNIAYDVLTNRETRLQYDGMFKRAGYPSSSLERTEGLTGPLNERAVPLGVRMSCQSAYRVCSDPSLLQSSRLLSKLWLIS